MWTRGTATEHVTLYTDIKAPKAVAFTTDHLQMLTGAGSLEVVSNEVALMREAPGTLSKATSLDPAGKGGTTTYAIPTTAAVTVTSLSFEGTLGGAMGTYKCADRACSVTVNDKGVVTAFAGADWTFTGATGAMLLLPDTDYLRFGWWVDEMANGKYAFQSFEGGSDPYYGGAEANDTAVATITGTATYKGAAAGLYVLKDVSGGQVTGASSGNFTANATLTASFGDVDTAGAISGSISDFANAYGEDLAGWGVTLNAASLNGVANATPMFSSSTRATIGSGTGTGTWQAQFYGTPADGAAGPMLQPTGVGGRFDAHFPGAHIAGAFGASK